VQALESEKSASGNKDNPAPQQAAPTPESGKVQALTRADFVDTGKSSAWVMALLFGESQEHEREGHHSIVVDSGSTTTACPKWFGAENPVVEFENLELRTVAGEIIPHHGRRTVSGHVKTDRGLQQTQMQFCDVAGPVASVAKLNDRGFKVCFPKDGAAYAEQYGL
jgi:hypothetical protein